MDVPREPLGDEVAAADQHPGVGRLFRKPPVVAVVLLVVYGLSSLLFDPAGHLSTDVGGKTASLSAMVDRGDHDPDLGYWLADRDPEGRLHPFASTVRTVDGQWINTTSLTMVMAARPLWAIGGPRAALLLPMSGAVAAALAGGALERRLRHQAGLDPGTGHRSIWIVGLATPVAVYALDFWEHSLGLAGMLWGVVAALDAIGDGETTAPHRHRHIGSALAAGLAFGLAATMRQEALVYGGVAGLVLVVVVARRVAWSAAVGRGSAMLAGFAVVTAANLAAEIALTGGPLRTARATGTASDAGSGLIERLHAGLVTLTFPFNDEHPLSYLLGLGLVVALGWWVWAESGGPSGERPRRFRGLAASTVRAVAACIAVVWVAFGLRFVPGLVPATPLAVAGAVAAFRHRRGLPLALALAPVPLVLAVQFTAGTLAQWGGRYLLLTGAVLAVSAIALLADEYRRLLSIVAAAGLAVTVYGVVWRVQRSSLVLEDWAALDAAVEPDTVVVFFDDHHAREAGARALDRRWLSGFSVDQRRLTSQLLLTEGEDAFVFVMPNGFEEAGLDPGFDGFEARPAIGELRLFESRLVPYVRTG